MLLSPGVPACQHTRDRQLAQHNPPQAYVFRALYLLGDVNQLWQQLLSLQQRHPEGEEGDTMLLPWPASILIASMKACQNSSSLREVRLPGNNSPQIHQESMYRIHQGNLFRALAVGATADSEVDHWQDTMSSWPWADQPRRDALAQGLPAEVSAFAFLNIPCCHGVLYFAPDTAVLSLVCGLGRNHIRALT